MSFIAEFYVFEKQQLNLYSNKIYSKENTRKNVHTMFRSNMDGLLPVVARMLLLPSWVFILFVAAASAAEPETARCLVLLVASAFWPLALSVGEEALAGAGRGVQLPQQDRVAARQEPMLLLKLVAAVVVVVAAVVAAAAVVAVAAAVEARHGRATVEKSLMKNGLPARFINYPGSAGVGRANFKQSWLTSFQI